MPPWAGAGALCGPLEASHGPGSEKPPEPKSSRGHGSPRLATTTCDHGNTSQQGPRCFHRPFILSQTRSSGKQGQACLRDYNCTGGRRAAQTRRATRRAAERRRWFWADGTQADALCRLLDGAGNCKVSAPGKGTIHARRSPAQRMWCTQWSPRSRALEVLSPRGGCYAEKNLRPVAQPRGCPGQACSLVRDPTTSHSGTRHSRSPQTTPSRLKGPAFCGSGATVPGSTLTRCPPP